MKLLRNLGFMLIGIFFGIVLIKAEVVSWWRIQEMFHFQSFHMYGIIGSAVIVGALSVILLKALKAKSSTGEVIDPQGKPFNKVGNFSGGTIFGLGWALTGACPGPLYALFGGGVWSIGITIIGALLGTFAYGLLRPKLPH
jgi:uncharacterized membrane protein YedE/YeeE